MKRIRNVLGPKLYRNLLGAKTSVSIFIEQLEPALLTGTDGPAKLLAELENGRFQRTGFQEMPRAYETFYEKTVFQRGGLEPMAMYLTAIEVCEARSGGMHSRTADFLEKSKVWFCPVQMRLTILRRSVRR